MTGIDVYDWSVFGGNPVPGDPDAVRAITSRFFNFSDEVHQQNKLVRAVGQDADSVWVGPAAQRFHPHVTKLNGQLDKLVASYRDAAEALGAFWPELRAAHDLAVTALARAQAARQAIEAAATQVQAAQSASWSTASAYNQASTALASTATPAPTDVANVQALQAGYLGAQVQLASANSCLAAANAEMAAAQGMKDTAIDQARGASSVCASGLHEASAAGIENPHRGWLSAVFDDVGNVAEGTWHAVSKDVVAGAEDVWHWGEDHEGLVVGIGLGLAGVALTVVNAAQLGLDPVTDAAEVADATALVGDVSGTAAEAAASGAGDAAASGAGDAAASGAGDAAASGGEDAVGTGGTGAGDPQLPIRWGPYNGPGPLGEDVASTFRSSTYDQKLLEEDSTLYHSYGGRSGPLSPFWSRIEPAGPLQSQLDNALNPAWGNTAENYSIIRVPQGAEVFEGVVGPQPLEGGGSLLGGGSQVYIPQVDPDWLIGTGR